MKNINWKIYCIILFVFFYSYWQGTRGIDFGYHWDEHRITDSIKQSAKDGLFLKRWYNYPSASFYIALLGVIPEVYNVDAVDKYDLNNIHEDNISRSSKDAIKFRIRKIFLFITLLSSIILFFLIYLWRKNYIEAFLGSTILLASWELQYHARWIAPDGLMMTFGFLSLCIMFISIKSKNLSTILLRVAAIFVGITCSTKYPGGIFLLPLFYSAYLIHANKKNYITVLIREYLFLIIIFIISFIAFTPGALLEPFKFIHDVSAEVNHYKYGNHGGYNVNSIFQHSWLMSKYIAYIMLSKYPIIAFTFFIFSCIGFLNLVTKNTRLAIWFLIVPVVYLFYFSMQKVMIVRNLLVLFPFQALLASRGIMTLVKYFQNQYLQKVLLFGVFAILLINILWITNAANSIQQKEIIDNNKNVVSFIEKRHNINYFLTPAVIKYSYIHEQNLPKNIVHILDQADKIIFLSNEITNREMWIINKPGIYKVISGTFEVNWDYYASWKGDIRILAVDKEIAQQLDLIKSF